MHNRMRPKVHTSPSRDDMPDVLPGLQVLQTRKAPFVRSGLAGAQGYHPDMHVSCTVLAGSRIQQVCDGVPF